MTEDDGLGGFSEPECDKCVDGTNCQVLCGDLLSSLHDIENPEPQSL